MALGWILLALQELAPGEPPVVPLAWDDFPVFVWREKYAGKPLPEELIEPFGGTLLMREEPSGWLRERGYAYLIFNAAGRGPLHLDADEAWNARVERWIETHDEKLLVREPCLNDPEVRNGLFATLEATLEKRAGDHGLGLSLGDEVSLTPNGSPLDLCRCDHCEAAWRAHAASRGLPARAPLTDEVRLALLEDDTSSLGAWLARRRFDHECVVALLEELVLRSRPGTDGPPLGLLGCTGRTPFGGVAIERLAQLDFVECYRTGDARELLETVRVMVERPDRVFPAPRTRSLATVFVEGESAAGLAWLAWEHWLRGGDGLVLWKDADLEKLPASHRARLERAVADIRSRLIPMAWIKQTRARAVGLLHDDDSDALGFLEAALLDGATWPRRNPSYQEEHGTRARKIKSWIRLLEDGGYPVASLPVESLGDGPSVPAVLVAPGLLVLGEGDIARLERHLERGGLLVVDGRLGWVDRAGAPHERDVLARLRERAPTRVREAPSLVASYLAARGNADVRENAARTLHALFAATDAAPPAATDGPALVGEAGRFPWLRASYGASGSTQAWLPNCPTREERSRLTDIELELTVPTGSEVEWLHPADGKILRAGDAAVFTLRRIDDPGRR